MLTADKESKMQPSPSYYIIKERSILLSFTYYLSNDPSLQQLQANGNPDLAISRLPQPFILFRRSILILSTGYMDKIKIMGKIKSSNFLLKTDRFSKKQKISLCTRNNLEKIEVTGRAQNLKTKRGQPQHIK